VDRSFYWPALKDGQIQNSPRGSQPPKERVRRCMRRTTGGVQRPHRRWPRVHRTATDSYRKFWPPIEYTCWFNGEHAGWREPRKSRSPVSVDCLAIWLSNLFLVKTIGTAIGEELGIGTLRCAMRLQQIAARQLAIATSFLVSQTNSARNGSGTRVYTRLSRLLRAFNQWAAEAADRGHPHSGRPSLSENVSRPEGAR